MYIAKHFLNEKSIHSIRTSLQYYCTVAHEEPCNLNLRRGLREQGKVKIYKTREKMQK